MPVRFDSNDLVVRGPRFAGAVCAAVGVGIIALVLRSDADAWGRIFACIIGGAFAVAGSVAALHRDELRVDFVRKRYERREGFLFTKEYSGGLEEFRRVVLAKVTGERDGYACSLVIERDGKEDTARLPGQKEEPEARATAARLCRALNVPLRDETGEEPVELAPEELELAFRERAALRRTAFDLKELADPPGRLAESITAAGPALGILLPRGRLGGAGCFLIAFALLWNGFVVFAVIEALREASEDPRSLIPLLLLSVFVAAGLGLSFLTGFVATGRERVALSPGSISVEMRFLSRSWMRREAKGAEVREVGLRPGQAGARPKIYVRTADEVMEFGSSLEREEIEWLERLVSAVLSAGGQVAEGNP